MLLLLRKTVHYNNGLVLYSQSVIEFQTFYTVNEGKTNGKMTAVFVANPEYKNIAASEKGRGAC